MQDYQFHWTKALTFLYGCSQGLGTLMKHIRKARWLGQVFGVL